MCGLCPLCVNIKQEVVVMSGLCTLCVNIKQEVVVMLRLFPLCVRCAIMLMLGVTHLVLCGHM